MQNETNLFTPNQLQGIELRNRIIRSATWEGMADAEGRVTGRLVEIYRQLAEGGVGLIISGLANVVPEGNAFPGCLGLFKDQQVEDIRQLAEAVHEGGGKLCLQLGHGGGQCSSKSAGTQPVAPSAVKVEQYPEEPRQLSQDEIGETVVAYAAAAKRARQAGCDAVQLHAAHGYLINEFLSPHTNQRTDQYGGDIDGRSRFLLEIVSAIQEAVGKNFPLLVKLNGSDNLDAGLQIDESSVVAKKLDLAGVAALEISGGTPASGDQGPVRRAHESGDEMAYNVVLSRTIRQQVGCPVIAVGGIRSLHVMTGLLRTGQADYISLSRPLVREPDLVNKLQNKQSEKATCISCNGCLKAAIKGNFRCVIDD